MNEHTTRTVGLDLGDRKTHICELDEGGEVVRRDRIATSRTAIEAYFKGRARMRIALEVGTHSRWVSASLASLGHEVLVANARKLRLIYEAERKTDRRDAELLARVARLDPKLLSPIRHRGATAQEHLAVIQSRDRLVETRTKLINHVRGSVKAVGDRLPGCSAKSFHRFTAEDLPESVRVALEPMLELIEALNTQIRAYERTIEALCESEYPETALLRQVRGVGAITALAFVLIVQDPARFRRSRDVGPYLGLVPRKDQSGDCDRQLHITKAGSPLLRRLLVHCAHYILGPFGAECDLRRWGQAIAARGGTSAKKRAVTAVARKLAVLLHHLWRNGDAYEPLYNTSRAELAA